MLHSIYLIKRNTCWRSRQIVSDKVISFKISWNSRSSVIIIIIGYLRLSRSIFEVQVCDLDFVLQGMTDVRADTAEINERMTNKIVIYILMLQTPAMHGYLPIKRMFPQQVFRKFHCRKVHNNFEYLSR